jgi:hypothetical protein
MQTDLDTFMKSNPPKAKISCMERYVKQIFQLKKNGYSNPQIRDWLEMNQVVVSHQAVRQFIVSRVRKHEHLDEASIDITL